MSLTLNDVSPDGDKLNPIAYLIFSENGRGKDKKIDTGGMRVYLDPQLSEEDKENKVGVNLGLKEACDIEQAVLESKVESKRPRSKIQKLSAEVKGSLGDEVELEHGHVFPAPCCKRTKEGEKKYRQVYYVSGPCDSGKSTWIAKMLRLWTAERKKLGLRTDIWLFSRVIGDSAFNGLPIMQIELNQGLLDNPFDTETELHDCMVIFDDIDSITDKDIREYLWKLRDELLTVNSHRGTYIMNTSHQLQNWKATRNSLSEAHTITIFPLSERPKLIEFLDKHVGLEKDHRNFIMNEAAFKSRWVTFSPRYPYYAVYEGGVKVMMPHKKDVKP
jgi:hypothetical protein